MQKNKIKVMTIVGTRPELIRLCRVISKLENNVNHILIHTGQNYDYELNETFFKDLKISKPKYYLNVDTSSLGKVLGGILIGLEPILKKEKPDAVLILGDTNSSIASIIVKRYHIPIYHMEAGNRSFDLNVPEEINRRFIDHISDFNLVYTEHSRRHLLSEGLHHRRIYLTGSPMKEVLDKHLVDINESKILNRLNLEKENYFLISMHREENVDDIKNLKDIIFILNEIAEKYKIPVIFSTHPRTQKMLDKLKDIKRNKLIQFLKPFGFFDYLKLQINSKCVISDSGTISEESSILNFRALNIRDTNERPEGFEEGAVMMTSLDKERILDCLSIIENQPSGLNRHLNMVDDYNVDNVSEKVLRIILSYTNYINQKVWKKV